MTAPSVALTVGRAEPTRIELEQALAFALDWYPGKSERYQNQIAAAWLRGYMNQPNPYEMKRGGNFAAGFRSAYREGQQAYRRKQAVGA